MRSVVVPAVAVLLGIAPSISGDVSVRKAAHAGQTRAVITYHDSGRVPWDVRIRIFRAGKQVFAETVPRRIDGETVESVVPLSGLPDWFTVRDLDGDGQPEVVLLVYWSGTYCYAWSRVYRFDRTRGTYVPANHFWGGNRAWPTLRNDGGRVEFVSRDDRFAALAAYIAVAEPIQIWSYDRGRFRDVTRRHPELILRNATRLWSYYLRYRAERETRGESRYVLAAWSADEFMLGRGALAGHELTRALHRGDLAYTVYRPRSPTAYLRALHSFLRKTGYIRG